MEGGGIAVTKKIMSKKVIMYTKAGCVYCERAKQLLAMKQVTAEEHRIDLDPSLREKMEKLTNRRTVPQIFIGETHVGGFDDLKALNDRGELDKLLAD